MIWQKIDFRFIIAVFIGVGIFGAITISMNTVERYNENPTVISMDRNMFFWNTSFPSLTICPHKKLNDLKVNQYIEWVKIFTARKDIVTDLDCQRIVNNCFFNYFIWELSEIFCLYMNFWINVLK